MDTFLFPFLLFCFCCIILTLGNQKKIFKFKAYILSNSIKQYSVHNGGMAEWLTRRIVILLASHMGSNQGQAIDFHYVLSTGWCQERIRLCI